MRFLFLNSLLLLLAPLQVDWFHLLLSYIYWTFSFFGWFAGELCKIESQPIFFLLRSWPWCVNLLLLFPDLLFYGFFAAFAIVMFIFLLRHIWPDIHILFWPVPLVAVLCTFLGSYVTGTYWVGTPLLSDKYFIIPVSWFLVCWIFGILLIHYNIHYDYVSN